MGAKRVHTVRRRCRSDSVFPAFAEIGSSELVEATEAELSRKFAIPSALGARS